MHYAAAIAEEELDSVLYTRHKVVEIEEDQRTHGRGQLRRSWEA